MTKTNAEVVVIVLGRAEGGCLGGVVGSFLRVLLSAADLINDVSVN